MDRLLNAGLPGVNSTGFTGSFGLPGAMSPQDAAKSWLDQASYLNRNQDADAAAQRARLAQQPGLDNALKIAGLQGQTQRDVAGLQGQTERDVTGLQGANAYRQQQLAGQNTLANTRQQGQDVYRQQQLAGQNQLANTRLQGTDAYRLQGLVGQNQLAQTRQQGTDAYRLGQLQSGTQRDVAGIQGQTQRDVTARQGSDAYRLGQLNTGTQRDIAGLQSRTALEQTRMPLEYQQGRFNQVFPIYQNTLKGLMGDQSPIGGQSAAGPHIFQGPVWTDRDIQQQVNAGRAHNDQTTAGQTATMRGELAGRGFGANSPLARLLQSQYQGQNMATNAREAQDTRWNAAQGNATQRTDAERLMEQQTSNRNTEDIERKKTKAGVLSTLLGQLGGFAS